MRQKHCWIATLATRKAARSIERAAASRCEAGTEWLAYAPRPVIADASVSLHRARGQAVGVASLASVI